MDPCKAVYITCMLILHVIRRAGRMTLEEKVHILHCASRLVLSLDTTRLNIYNCETSAMLV
jgi:hypothetical protein